MKNIIAFAMLFTAISQFCPAQEIDTVLANIERNNLELQALRQENEASALEIKAENNIQQDLSVSYSPFFTNGVNGVASSEFVASMGFDFPTQYAARKKWGDFRSEELRRLYLLQRRDILFEAKTLCLELIRLNAEKKLLDNRLFNIHGKRFHHRVLLLSFIAGKCYYKIKKFYCLVIFFPKNLSSKRHLI